MEELSAGIVGTGFIGEVHARSARLAGGRVAAVAASTPERGRAAAARIGADRAHDSWEDLVVDPSIDVVHVCAPNHLHVPVTEAALEHGKHVVCEKPLATDADGAARLAHAATRVAAIATVPFVYRYYPTVREARARVAAGDAGPLHLLHGRYLQDWLLRPEDDNWRVEPELGGASRAFADIGSHWCDLVEFVSGHRIVELAAQVHTAVPSRSRGGNGRAFDGAESTGEARAVTTEDQASVMFRTDQGALGSLLVSQVAPGHKNSLRFELSGSDQTLAFDQEQPETLWVGARESSTVVSRAPEALSPEAAAYAVLPGGHPQGYNDCFAAFVAETYAAVRGDRPADGLPTFADGERAARAHGGCAGRR